MALKNLMGGVATDDAIIMLRRLCDLMESNSIVDVGGRQRVILDTGSVISTVSTVTTVTTVSTVSSVTNVAAVAGYDHRQFMDGARTAYNTGIRSNLSFS